MQMIRQLFTAATAVPLLLVSVGCESRTVICRVPVPGHTSAQVTFVQVGHDYRVEFPDGAFTKGWRDVSEATPDEIRKNCRVEYKDKTLRIVGPRATDWLEVPGYPL